MRLLRFVRRPKARAAVAAPAQPAPRTSRRRALRKWLAPRVFVLAAAVAPIIPRLPHDTTPVVVMHAAAPHAPKQLPGGIDGETPEVVFLEAASKPRLLDRAAASLKRRTKALPELFGRQASKARRVAAQTIAPRDDESKGRSYSGAPSFAAQAAEKVGPAVVRVDVERADGVRYSHASGFCYDSAKALVLTNAHVVHGATRVSVVTSTGERYRGTVLGADAHTDIAVLRMDTAGRRVPQAPVVDQDSLLRVGDWVVAIGHPIGLDHTVTLGIVSSLGRSLSAPRDTQRTDNSPRWADRVRFIQTDAAINPGNSGGPLLDRKGRVVGINTATAAHADGIGFAVPARRALRVAADLEKGQQAAHAYLGLELAPLTPAALERVESEDEPVRSGGALVHRVVPGSPADAAGLAVDDVVVAVGGKPVRDVAAVLAAVDDAEVGETVRVTVRRPAETLDIEVVAADLQTRTFDADAEAVPQASESKGGGAGSGGGGPLVAGGRGDRSGDAPGDAVAAGAVAAAATKAHDALADELLLSILLVRGPPVPVLN